jgi:hypothetical protein
MKGLVYLIIGTALTGCSEQGFQNVDGLNGGFGPTIEVSPARLTYDTLSDGETEVQTFKVTNVGSDALHIESIEISGSSSFTLLTTELAVTLAPEAFNTFDVMFSPMEANASYGSAVILSDDPENEISIVELKGEGAVPELEIDPDPYDFGIDYVGCGYNHEFTLSNVGTEALVIDSVGYESDDAQLSMSPFMETLPLVLEPEQATSVWVDFMPSLDSESSGSIVVNSNDPRGEVRSTHTGEGVYANWLVDEFEVPVNPPVDIIFAIDRSCSMDDDAASLANNFSAFISSIASITTEFNIGVVTADTGCFNTVIDNTTTGYEAMFSNAVLANNKGSNTEKLLTLMKSTIQAGSTCNSGFFRPDAIVHGIMVSDEPEQSSQSWSTLVSNMQDLVGDPNRLKLSAIAGDYPSGCGSAGAGTGYYEAVTATGGEFLSICSNWAVSVDVLAAASTDGLLDFELSSTPVVSSIVVTVNGAQWLADWHYEPSSNSVVFDLGLDDESTIVIEYGEIVECD